MVYFIDETYPSEQADSNSFLVKPGPPCSVEDQTEPHHASSSSIPSSFSISIPSSASSSVSNFSFLMKKFVETGLSSPVPAPSLVDQTELSLQVGSHRPGHENPAGANLPGDQNSSGVGSNTNSQAGGVETNPVIVTGQGGQPVAGQGSLVASFTSTLTTGGQNTPPPSVVGLIGLTGAAAATTGPVVTSVPGLSAPVLVSLTGSENNTVTVSLQEQDDSIVGVAELTREDDAIITNLEAGHQNTATIQLGPTTAATNFPRQKIRLTPKRVVVKDGGHEADSRLGKTTCE